MRKWRLREVEQLTQRLTATSRLLQCPCSLSSSTCLLRAHTWLYLNPDFPVLRIRQRTWCCSDRAWSCPET
jgi:hypothetical protein